MAADRDYLGQQAVDGDPGVNVDYAPEEDAHELVVVGDVHEVLVGHCHAAGQVHTEDDPGTEARVAEHGEGAHEDAIAEKEQLES